jgi:hypothetical protein
MDLRTFTATEIVKALDKEWAAGMADLRLGLITEEKRNSRAEALIAIASRLGVAFEYVTYYHETPSESAEAKS